jgi:hypothetical protein
VKHPDKVTAETYRREAAGQREQAAGFRKLAGVAGGVAPDLKEAYSAAAAALDKLATALDARAELFEESANSEGALNR